MRMGEAMPQVLPAEASGEDRALAGTAGGVDSALWTVQEKRMGADSALGVQERRMGATAL